MPTDAFIPYHALVTAPEAKPSRWMIVLHGILGSGGNFRSFARRLATASPDWGFVLVDLRMHGLSQGAPPPHTIAAAADDLVRLGDHLALPIAGVMGHSFGGKVALAYTERRGAALDLAWVLDASPGTRRDRAGSTEAVLRMLQAMPQPLPSRERFLEIVASHGHPPAIGEWLAMNVRRADDGFRIRLDLDAIGELLDDYFAVDLWPVVERAEGARSLHVVVADRSEALDAQDRARLAAIAARDPRVVGHLIEGAGHWVHVDAPDALFGLVSASLAEK
ncbi:hydrolase, alpha/beta fold family, putative [Minicystis rosea]|nr:hydrolase, alpha/beta fold family, putative [Minicystis rosea]